MVDQYGTTALMNGVWSDSPLVVQKLLSAGAQCNILKDDGQTALHIAAETNNVGIIQLLVISGADTESRNQYNATPVSISILNCHTEAVQVMLFGECYTDVNQLSRTCGTNFFLYALKQRKYLICKCLLLCGHKITAEYQGWESFKATEYKNLTKSELHALNFIITHINKPLSLQNLCRLVLRASLRRNIRSKVKTLPLPLALQEFICYKDVYLPPDINLTHNVSSYSVSY